MTTMRIAVEFEGSAFDARALARAIQFTFEASRVGDGTVYIEGFGMNPSDKWHVGDPQISITEKKPPHPKAKGGTPLREAVW